MTIHLDVEGRAIPFRLDWKNWRWHSLDELEEGAFPDHERPGKAL